MDSWSRIHVDFLHLISDPFDLPDSFESSQRTGGGNSNIFGIFTPKIEEDSRDSWM